MGVILVYRKDVAKYLSGSSRGLTIDYVTRLQVNTVRGTTGKLYRYLTTRDNIQYFI